MSSGRDARGAGLMVVILIVTVLLTFASCGDASQSTTAQRNGGRAHHPIAGSITSTTLIAASPQWASEGQRLIQYKQSMNAQVPSGVAGSLPLDSGSWAYQSLPVNVTDAGTYAFDFGPIASSDLQQVTSADTFDWPSDLSFIMEPAGQPAPGIVEINGKQYFQAEFRVTQFVSAYPDLTGWIY